MSSSKSLIVNALGTGVIRVIGIALNLLSTVVLGRLLGADGYGVFAFAYAFAIVLSVVAVAGTDNLTTREVARALATMNSSMGYHIIKWAKKTVFGITVTLSIIIAFLLYAFEDELGSTKTDALLISLPLIAVLAFLRLNQGVLQGFSRILHSQFPMLVIFPGALILITLITNIINKVTAISAITICLAAAISALFVSSLWLFKAKKGLRRTPIHNTTSKEWRRSTLSLGFVAVMAMLNDQVGILMLGILSTSDLAGLLDVARKSSALVAFSLMIVNMPLAPLVAQYYAKADGHSLQIAVRKAARLALIIGGLIVIFLTVFGEHVLRLFGPDFEVAYPALLILCIGQLVNVASGSVGVLLTMTGYERDAAKGLVISTVLNIILCAILIKPFGLIGAAISSAVAVITWNLILVYMARIRLSIKPTAVGI